MKFQERKWGKGFKINLSYEIRLSIEMLCFQRAALLWEVRLVIGCLSGNFWHKFLSYGYIRSAECILNGCIKSAEDSRRPQPKVHLKAQTKEVAGATPGGRRVQYLQSTGELWVHLSLKAWCRLKHCPVIVHCDNCQRAPGTVPRQGPGTVGLWVKYGPEGICKRPAWFGGQVLVLWTQTRDGSCS